MEVHHLSGMLQGAGRRHRYRANCWREEASNEFIETIRGVRLSGRRLTKGRITITKREGGHRPLLPPGTRVRRAGCTQRKSRG